MTIVIIVIVVIITKQPFKKYWPKPGTLWWYITLLIFYSIALRRGCWDSCFGDEIIEVQRSYMPSISSVQSLSRVQLFATPRSAARQASLPITNSRTLLKLTSIESVMPSSHLILCRPLLLLPPIPPSVRVFSMSQLFTWGGQSTGVPASASVLPMNTQDWSPLGWTGWISLQSKGLSRVFPNTTIQKHQFFSTQLSSQTNSHIHIWPLVKP